VADATQIAVEQEYFDHAAECRERSRATLIAAPANAAVGKGSAVKRMADEYLARMAGPDEAVAIGRFETQDQTLYVGKRRISDDDGEPLVINWQAEAAAPFYTATFDEPIGVLRTRSFSTEKNHVLDFEETVFADLAGRVAALTSNEYLGINDTVLRDLDEDRTGEMRDIVQRRRRRAPGHQLAGRGSCTRWQLAAAVTSGMLLAPSRAAGMINAS
jgi:hypothetical protein